MAKSQLQTHQKTEVLRHGKDDFAKPLLWVLFLFSCLTKYMCEECPPHCFCSFAEGGDTGTQLMSCFGLFPSEVPRTLHELVIMEANVSSLTSDEVVPLGRPSSLHIMSSRISSIAENAFSEANMVSLRDLRLSNNEINSLETNTFANLSQIEELFLDGNNIRTVKGVLSRLTTLQELHLENNYLEEIPSDLPLSLTQLFLNNNNIHTVSFVGISYRSLQYLNLCENSFARLSHENISLPESLNELCLGNYFYDIDPLIFLAKRKSLQNLILKTTRKLTRYSLDAISTFRELKSLTISGAMIYRLPSWKLKVLPELETLSLTEVKCSSKINDNFFTSEFLREMDLSGSPDITKAVLNSEAFLENSNSLRVLKLRGTSIKEISDDVMPVIQNLEQLDISNNNLICDCNLCNVIRNSRANKLHLLSPGQTSCFQESTQETYLILDKRLHLNCNETGDRQSKSFDEDCIFWKNNEVSAKASGGPHSSSMNGLHYTIICLIILITVLLIIIFYLLVKYLRILRRKRCTVSTIF